MVTTTRLGTSSDSTIFLIPCLEVPHAWAYVKEILEENTKLFEDYFDVQDIFGALTAGGFQLWIVRDAMGPYFVCITELRAFPKCRVCEFVFAAGSRYEEAMREHLHIIENWARDRGAKFMVESGRPGWQKALAKYGYEPQSVYLRKELEERVIN